MHSQLKSGRAPGENGITIEMLSPGAENELKAVQALLNRTVGTSQIPQSRNNAYDIVLIAKTLVELKVIIQQLKQAPQKPNL